MVRADLFIYLSLIHFSYILELEIDSNFPLTKHPVLKLLQQSFHLFLS